jgi:hypothetical protein
MLYAYFVFRAGGRFQAVKLTSKRTNKDSQKRCKVCLDCYQIKFRVAFTPFLESFVLTCLAGGRQAGQSLASCEFEVGLAGFSSHFPTSKHVLK